MPTTISHDTTYSATDSQIRADQTGAISTALMVASLISPTVQAGLAQTPEEALKERQPLLTAPNADISGWGWSQISVQQTRGNELGVALASVANRMLGGNTDVDKEGLALLYENRWDLYEEA